MPAKLKTVWWQRSHEDLALLSDEELAGCKELETAELVELSDVQMEAYAAASLHVQRVMLERARLHELVERERNKPKPPPPKPKLLTITEVDGKENVVRVDPWEGGWLTVETNDAKPDEPWIIQPVVRRLGLMGIRSITVEDVNDE